jgi:hypothetical protein
MARPPDVFLSDGPDTRPLAEQLVKALDEGGLRSWARIGAGGELIPLEEQTPAP